MSNISLTPAKYAQQISRSTLDAEEDRYYDRWEDDNTIPWADSPEDVSTRAIPLDGGTAIVETLPGRVEVTVKLGTRLAAALVLSPDEAQQIGHALAHPQGFTLDDYLTMRDQLSGGAR